MSEAYKLVVCLRNVFDMWTSIDESLICAVYMNIIQKHFHLKRSYYNAVISIGGRNLDPVRESSPGFSVGIPKVFRAECKICSYKTKGRKGSLSDDLKKCLEEILFQYYNLKNTVFVFFFSFQELLDEYFHIFGCSF